MHPYALLNPPMLFYICTELSVLQCKVKKFLGTVNTRLLIVQMIYFRLLQSVRGTACRLWAINCKLAGVHTHLSV